MRQEFPDTDIASAELFAARQARSTGYRTDYGIERNRLFRTLVVFPLPRPDKRYGHELRCQVVDEAQARMILAQEPAE